MAKWCQDRFNAYELRWFLVSLIVILSASEMGRWLEVRAGDRGGGQVDPGGCGTWAIGIDDRVYFRHGFVAL
jgi:hypothetical protein